MNHSFCHCPSWVMLSLLLLTFDSFDVFAGQSIVGTVSIGDLCRKYYLRNVNHVRLRQLPALFRLFFVRYSRYFRRLGVNYFDRVHLHAKQIAAAAHVHVQVPQHCTQRLVDERQWRRPNFRAEVMGANRCCC